MDGFDLNFINATQITPRLSCLIKYTRARSRCKERHQVIAFTNCAPVDKHTEMCFFCVTFEK